jgi:hypothetical protein
MKIICSVCKKVIGHKAPYEDNRESHSYCWSCYSIMKSCDFNYKLKDNGTKITIIPIT